MPFPTAVNVQPAPAVAGDFASTNPRFSVIAGQGGFVSGPAGVTVGRAAWANYSGIDNDNSPTVVNSFGVGPITGLVHRAQQALITIYLQESTLVIAPGFEMDLFSGGDLWVKNEGSTQALIGQKAYANFTSGALSFAATGSATTTAAATSTVAASTFSVTASVTGNVMTVTAVSSGTVVNGATVSGGGMVAGTQVVAQLTPLLTGEATGGVGRYALNIPEQTVASTTISGTYGTLTLGGAPSNGNFVVGGIISGTSVVAGTQVTQLLTGSGGNGSTFAVNNNTVVGSTTITETLNVETKFVAMSVGIAGELVKVSDHALG